MEFNKRKSLLTPAAPTVWGMIYGDIDNQKDISDKISDMVDKAVGVDLSNKIKGEIYTDLNPTLDTFATKESLNETNTEVSSVIVVANEAYTQAESALTLANNAVKPTDMENVYIPQIKKYIDDQIVEVEGVVNDGILEVNNNLVNYATLEYVNTQIGAIDTITQDILG